jgi:hypothetical protein
VRDGEPNQYTGLCNIYNGLEQQHRGRIITTFFLFNAAAIPIVLGTTQPELIKLLISLTGLVVHAGLFAASLRAFDLIRFWEERLAELERLDQEEITDVGDKGTRITGFSHPAYRRIQRSTFTTFGHFGPFVVGVFVWLIISLYYGWRILLGMH